MRSTVSCDWLPSYIKATRPVLEIFKMVGYFPDSPHMYVRVSLALKPTIIHYQSVTTTICGSI